jgi:IclR family transcriptional regulator, acetate operon repressor
MQCSAADPLRSGFLSRRQSGFRDIFKPQRLRKGWSRSENGRELGRVSRISDRATPSSHIKSAERVLAILAFLARRARPVPSMAIARECGLPRSSAYHLLSVMRSRDFVTYYPEERAWGLGVAAFEIGSAYLRSEPLERLGRPVLVELATETGETAHLAVLHGNEVLYLLKERPEGFETKLVTEVGVRLPAHLTAVGRAMLMYLPAAQLQALYPSKRPLVRRTERGPERLGELEAELRQGRVLGYAVDDQMTTPGITCIAAPVFSHESAPLAAVGITFLSASRAESERLKLARRVQQAAIVLSRGLGWHGDELGEVALR